MMARCWAKTAGFVVLFGFAVHCAMAKSRCGRLEMAWFISMLNYIRYLLWCGVGSVERLMLFAAVWVSLTSPRQCCSIGGCGSAGTSIAGMYIHIKV